MNSDSVQRGEAELKIDARLSELRRSMAESDLVAGLIVDPDNQFYLRACANRRVAYVPRSSEEPVQSLREIPVRKVASLLARPLSGFKAVIYSRPILLFVRNDKTSIVVPGLEEAHAEDERAADEVLVYYEHPEMAHYGKSHLDHLDELLKSLPTGAPIGVEMNVCSAALANHIERRGLRVTDIGRKLVEMRYVKDQEEVRRIANAGRLVNLAVSVSLTACKPGVTELEIDATGNAALFEEAARKYPAATLEAMSFSPAGAERSAWPHVFSNTRKLKEGDVLVHSRQVSLSGYRAELERTVIIGKPTNQQRRAFEAARGAQQAALDFIKPGVTAADVDRVAREVIQESGFGEYAIHRVGHGLGISAHEEPHLRFDNELVLEEGMVFTVEPGIYITDLGGFRHSDTVILTADGNELLTECPRDLSELTIA